jgi:hypothetical protein
VGTFVAGDISALTTSVTALTDVVWPTHSGDDLAILAHGYGDGTNTGTMDAGFTNIADLTDTNLRAVVGKRIPTTMTGSESGAVTLTTTTGARQVGALVAYNGYSDVQQIVSQAETSGTAVTTHASPAITPQRVGSGFVIIYMDRVSAGNTTVTPPAGFTLREEFGTLGTGGILVHVADDLSGTHGTTPFTPASWTVAVGSTSAEVILLELAPILEATGDRTATATLTGAATAARLATGDRTASATLTGAGSVARNASGNRTATATLAGDASVTVTVPPADPFVPRSPFLIEVWDGTVNPFVEMGRVGSYVSSEVVLRHNQVGSWKFTMNLSDGGVDLLTPLGRRITIDYRGTRILSGPVWGVRRSRQGVEDQVEVYGYSDLVWLDRRLAFPNPLATFPADGVAFTQPSFGDFIGDNAETAVKYWVTRNCVTRQPVPGLTVATDLGRGAVLGDAPRFKTVLETCAKLAGTAGIGLSLQQVGSELVFDIYVPAVQPVRLSRSLGNLRDWEFVNEGPNATRVVIGGPGERLAREYTLGRVSTSETGWGITETFIESSADTQPERYQEGIDHLMENTPTYSFSVVPQETESMRFGETYHLGDVVDTELFPTVTLTDIVREVTITDSVDDGVDVKPIIGNLEAAKRTDAVYLELRRLRAQINKRERET